MLKNNFELADARGDVTEQKLIEWLLRKKKLELGPMSYVIKRVTEKCDTDIFTLFRENIVSLTNYEFLLSSDFQEICKEITTKFRNGGVHEKIVTYEICKEAFHKILEMPENYLSRLASVGNVWIN